MKKSRNKAEQLNIILGSMGSYGQVAEILSELPENYSMPVIVAVHRERHASSRLAETFSAHCILHVREIEDKDMIEPGVVFLAPPGYHLLIDNRKMILSTYQQENSGVPSFDLLLHSAADAYQSAVCCVILSGANDDGSKGAQQVFKRGGTVLIQDPKEAEYPAMPGAAIKTVPAAQIMKAKAIGKLLVKMGE